MSTGAYIRVSTADQNEASQKREVRKYLKGRGITDVVWYIDKSTGDNLERPDFQRLERDIFNGEIKTVIVYRLDRLSRSFRDGITTICNWADNGVRIVAVTQQIDISGTIGKMVCAILLGVAEMEQESRRERQAAGIEVAKENGVYTGRKAGTTKAKPSRAKTLKAKGFNNSEIAKSLGVSRHTVIRYIQS